MATKDKEKIRKQYLKYRQSKLDQGYVHKRFFIPTKYVPYVQRIVNYLKVRFEAEKGEV